MSDGLPFSPFEVRDDSNPSGDGLSHLNRAKLGGAATDTDELLMCDIKRGTKLAKLLIETSLIIWDEALMTNKQCFEAFDRSLRDIMTETNEKAIDIPFGGKVIVLGGDPKQILPVIENGSKTQIINASIISSYLWSSVKILFLTENTRLKKTHLSPTE